MLALALLAMTAGLSGGLRGAAPAAPELATPPPLVAVTPGRPQAASPASRMLYRRSPRSGLSVGADRTAVAGHGVALASPAGPVRPLIMMEPAGRGSRGHSSRAGRGPPSLVR